MAGRKNENARNAARRRHIFLCGFPTWVACASSNRVLHTRPLLAMDLLSADIVINVVLPFLPKCSLVALDNSSKRYHRLILSWFPYASRKHLEILGEICECGYINMLRWFIGRGKLDLRWSLQTNGVRKLVTRGKI